MFALINACKPPGISSYDVIRRLRRRLPAGEKVGHAGTLDVLAEGVLVLCLGAATRLAGLVQSYPKEYLTVVELGAFSDTDDAEGPVRPVSPPPPAPSPQAVASAVGRFVGTISQVPPAHSAVKVAGRRAYDLARRGRPAELSARQVHVHRIDVIEYRYPLLRLRVACGGGTYIRSLARDIGGVLATGGFCRELVRTRIGPFAIEQAVRLERFDSDALESLLIDPAQAVPPERRVAITAQQHRRLALGQAAPAEPPPAPPEQPERELGAIDPAGRLAALVRWDASAACLRPVKVFLPP